MPLTDAAVRNTKPSKKARKLFDANGLYLEVAASGGKWWRFKYRCGGKEKRISLGVYPDVTLKDARERRDEARKLLVNGIDPSEHRKAAEDAKAERAANSLESVAREWHEHKRPRWSEKHAVKVMQSLEADVFPHVGKRPIAEITAPELLRVIRIIENRDALDYSHRVLQRIGMLFRYAIASGRASYNPAADLKGALKVRKATHYAALSHDDLPAFLHSLDNYEGHLLTRYGLQLIALTFLRTAELRTAEWHEIDFDRAEWRVPAKRMKMNHEHIVPLSTQAMDVLNALRPITGQYRYIFTGRNSTTRPMSENTLLYALYRMGYKRQATVHGFRATASTILNESGFNRDAIERQLAHVEGNKVRAAYHRSEYLDERRTMMQWWANYLGTLSREVGVVPANGNP